MAETPRAMNVLCIPRVDPKLYAVAIVDPRIAAPGRLLLAANNNTQRDTRLIPAEPYIGKGLSAVQLCKTGKSIFLIELDSASRPGLALLWDHEVHELLVVPQELPLRLCLPEQLAQLFEQFGVPSD